LKKLKHLLGAVMQLHQVKGFAGNKSTAFPFLKLLAGLTALRPQVNTQLDSEESEALSLNSHGVGLLGCYTRLLPGWVGITQ